MFRGVCALSEWDAILMVVGLGVDKLKYSINFHKFFVSYDAALSLLTSVGCMDCTRAKLSSRSVINDSAGSAGRTIRALPRVAGDALAARMRAPCIGSSLHVTT